MAALFASLAVALMGAAGTRASVDPQILSSSRPCALRADGWDCSGSSEAFSPLSLDTAPPVRECSRVIVVADSVGRQMLMDYTSSQRGCDGGSNSTMECAALRTARQVRGDYSVMLPALSSGAVSPRDVPCTFFSVTTARDIPRMPWFSSVFLEPAAPGTVVILNTGMWNLRYDVPREGVGERYLEELSALAASIAARTPGAAPVVWRTTTAVTQRAAFPEGFEELVTSAGAAAATQWAAAGYKVVDVSQYTQLAAAGPPPRHNLTVDGMHYHPWVNAAMMAAVLREACSGATGSLTTGAHELSVGPALASAVAVALVCVAVVRRREQLAQVVRSPIGALITLVAVSGLAAVCNTSKSPKDRPASIDSMSAWVAIALFGALMTMTVAAARPSSADSSFQPTAQCADDAYSKPAAVTAAISTASGDGAIVVTTVDGSESAVVKSRFTGGSSNSSGISRAPSLCTYFASLLASPAAEPVSMLMGRAIAPPGGVISGVTAAQARRDAAPFMPLDLTNETKGASMVFFLLYHYWDVKAVYNPVRVLVGVFIFLTGYGNAVSLHAKPPTLHKLATSLVRINFMACLFMMATQQPWMLYYICPLHSVWTVVVYAAHAIRPSLAPIFGRRATPVMLLCTGCVLLVVGEVAALRAAAFSLLAPLLRYSGSMYEWGFRYRLDAYACFAGMVLGAAKPSVERAYAWLAMKPRLITVAAAVALAVVLVAHGAFFFRQPRNVYNEGHRFSSVLPIFAYLLLRNLTPSLRAMHSRLLAFAGTSSLEFYLLQFHLWMAGNAKTVVLPFPGARLLSFVAQTAAFIALSWACTQAQAPILKRAVASAPVAYGLTAAVLAVIVVCTHLFGGA